MLKLTRTTFLGYYICHRRDGRKQECGRVSLAAIFFVDVPPETGGDSHAGWLQFGQPGVRTSRPLPPAHLERPAPGRLVLFPSYMWRGAQSLVSAQPRTTIAFDIVPAQ
jgi:hypothetical protein